MLVLLRTTAFADSGGTHVVRAGETLNSIAASHGVSATALARANGITNPNMIKIGQRLVIPSGGPGSSSGSAAKPASRTYVVRRGDTLGSIALRLGVSASSLAAANGISNPDRIYPGKVLRVPVVRAGPPARYLGLSRPRLPGPGSLRTSPSQHCWLYVGGKLVGNWRCSTGRRGAGTMSGTFKVQSKIRNAWASTWNFWMPYWLGIYWAGSTENGIHGLPYNGDRAQDVGGHGGHAHHVRVRDAGRCQREKAVGDGLYWDAGRDYTLSPVGTSI